jgi:hypothetical protein
MVAGSRGGGAQKVSDVWCERCGRYIQGKSSLPLSPHEIAGPVNPILANYILFRIKQEIKSPDAEQFGEKLLQYLEAS